MGIIVKIGQPFLTRMYERAHATFLLFSASFKGFEASFP
jgi:hypothetical protein